MSSSNQTPVGETDLRQQLEAALVQEFVSDLEWGSRTKRPMRVLFKAGDGHTSISSPAPFEAVDAIWPLIESALAAVRQETAQRGIYAEIRDERERAHAKHGDTSMEGLPVFDMTRLSVLVEEVGEVAREFNEARHRRHQDLLPQVEREQSVDFLALRKELVQVAAMAAAWADNINSASVGAALARETAGNQ